MRTFKMTIIGLLAATWALSIAASARLVRHGRFESKIASEAAAETASGIDAVNVVSPSCGVTHTLPATRFPGNEFSIGCSQLGTALALAALVIPGGLSMLSILGIERINRDARRASSSSSADSRSTFSRLYKSPRRLSRSLAQSMQNPSFRQPRCCCPIPSEEG